MNKKCKYCRNELTDFNEFSKNDPYRLEIGIPHMDKNDGMVYFCNNQQCKNYHKMLVKGFDFGRGSMRMKYWRFLDALSEKWESICTSAMRKAGDVILSGLLACFIGTAYFLLEVIWKTIQGHPEGISWTMLVLALLLGLVLERMGAELPWRCPIWAQAILCGLTITAAEFVVGCIVNLWLDWGVWDYSGMPGNLLGQVCPQFWLLWCAVSGPVIVGLDWMRYAVRGGPEPYYNFT